MLKQIITACAGVIISGSSVLAANVTGVYSATANGQTVSIELRGEGDVRGMFRTDSGSIPLVARENDGRMQGTFQGNNGQQMPFVAATDGTHLQVSVNGQAMVFERSNAGNTPEAQVAPAEQPRQQFAPRQQGNLIPQTQMGQGQYFQYALPQGWQPTESCAGMQVTSPDNTMTVGFVGTEAMSTRFTPSQYAQMSMSFNGIANWRVLDAKPVPANVQGGEAIEEIVSYTANGIPCKGWVRCVVVTGFGQCNGYTLFAAAEAGHFDQGSDGLKALADKIQITNPAAVFQRDIRAGNMARTVVNRPMDHSFVDSYWKNQKVNEDVSGRRSDVMRNSYGYTDESTGQTYHFGAEAYDATIGGVRNPNRPTEILTPDQRWQGR
jgi:hypothetical protein